MAKATKKLSARAVISITDPGRHSDGDGLYLQVTSTGAKSWLFMFKRDGKRSEVGLGSVRDVTLADARQKAADARKIIDAGKNPLDERRAAEAARKAQVTKLTFGEVADSLIESIAAGFRNAKHLEQWRTTLGPSYCSSIRPKAVDAITTEDVLAVLEPIWTTKAETASRIRGRIERVLDAARAKGLRSGENPALWRGHLDSLLPKRQKLQRGHHAAMPYADVSSFIASLKASEGVTARALEYLILTAARSGEVREARWGELDLKAKVWTVPAHRMKAGREHRVPLSGSAIDILHRMKPPGADEPNREAYIFPGARKMKPLSVMAFDMQLRRLDCEYTVHGFRSAFRDWVGEETAFQREVAEAALAHTVGDEVERAYRRGDALEKRRALMEAWASFCAGDAAKVDQGHPEAREIAVDIENM